MIVSTRVTSLTPGSLRVAAVPAAPAGRSPACHRPLPPLAGGEDRPDAGLALLLDRMIGQPVQIFLAGGLTLQGVLAAATGDTLVLAGSGPVTYVNARDVSGIAAGTRPPAAAGRAVTATMRTAPPPVREEPEPAPAATDARPLTGETEAPGTEPAGGDAEAPVAGKRHRPVVLFTQRASFAEARRPGARAARAAVRSCGPGSLRCYSVAIVH